MHAQSYTGSNDTQYALYTVIKTTQKPTWLYSIEQSGIYKRTVVYTPKPIDRTIMTQDPE